jgi:hypothetical protein
MNNPLAHKGSLPEVKCPGCQRLMDVMFTEAIPNGQVKVTYRCGGCGTETDRIMRLNVGSM